jgi:hypothetical protein
MNIINFTDPVFEIIARKKQGVDCTEQESAEIKGWLKEILLMPENGSIVLVEDIQRYFPMEYGEYLDETNQ